MKLIRRFVDRYTRLEYSVFQALGWLLLGHWIADSWPWWKALLAALGVLVVFGAVNDLIRLAFRLPRVTTITRRRPIGTRSQPDDGGFLP